MQPLNLARKYRPKSLEEVQGQEQAVKLLEEAFRSNRFAPAYLFSGPRGVGKTSLARIIAKAAACSGKTRPCGKCASCEALQAGTSMGVLEIDGASHTSVEDVRKIIETVSYKPSVGVRNVYIVDEVHMLSTAAFNALLKTLEEPPPHVIFLFATTEIEKIPSTILSRVQRLELRRLKEVEIVQNLEMISKEEKISVSKEILEQIASASDGCLRDAQTLLEQLSLLSHGKTIQTAVVDSFLGTIGQHQEIELLQLVASHNIPSVLQKVEAYDKRGKDLEKLLDRLLLWTRSLIITRACGGEFPVEKDFPEDLMKNLLASFQAWSLEDCDRLFEIFSSGRERMRQAERPKISFEICLLRACRIPHTEDLKRILDALENEMPTQAVAPAQHAPPAPPPMPQFIPSAPPKKVAEAPPPLAPVVKPKAGDHMGLLAGLKIKRPSLHALLLGGQGFEWKEDVLLIKFAPDHFAIKQLSERLIKDDLEKILSEIAETKIKLKIEEIAGAKETPPRDFLKEAKSQILKDPKLQKAAEALGGKISSVNVEGIKL